MTTMTDNPPQSSPATSLSAAQRALILALYDAGAVKFGDFTLKSGIKSPIYIDLRVTVSYPDLLKQVATELAAKVADTPHDLLCGVPYTALPFATVMSVTGGKPMVMRRKEAKGHGLKKLLEGVFEKGMKVVVVEDLVTSGGSVWETIESLKDQGLIVDIAVALLDREQGGKLALKEKGVDLKPVFGMADMVDCLLSAGKVDKDTADAVIAFVKNNQVDGKKDAKMEETDLPKKETQAAGDKMDQITKVDKGGKSASTHAMPDAPGEKKMENSADDDKGNGSISNGDTSTQGAHAEKPTATNGSAKPEDKHLTYAQRAEKVQSMVGRRLLELMETKKTNLAVAADVTSKSALLELADKVGPEICMLKTHADIVSDWDAGTGPALAEIANRHQFMIFEDRKFADIGNTVVNQVSGGVHSIAKWADVVNAHSVPGQGVIQGLKKASETAQQEHSKTFGTVLLAEMSSEGNLATALDGYKEKTIEMAEAAKEFVFGFISMGRIASDEFIYMTPGVRMAGGGDELGQQYANPHSVIGERGSDIIIVGRGIYKADNPTKEAKAYRAAGWRAYETRCSGAQ